MKAQKVSRFGANVLASIAALLFAAGSLLLFSSCESTQVGNYDGTGQDSKLSNIPHSHHEDWETNARYGNLPQSRQTQEVVERRSDLGG